MRVQVSPGRAGSWRPWAFDGGIALLLVALGLGILASIVQRTPHDHVPLGVALVVAHGGSVAWRRRAPLPVLAVGLATGGAFCALGFPAVALGVALPVAVYSVGAHVDRRRSLMALLVAVAGMAATLSLTPERSDPSTITGNAIVLGVAWFLGDAQRARRAYVEELEERTAELEEARGELARQAVAAERVRIARELHDVVAHSLGMIAVQAGVGRHVIDARPGDAKTSLETIERASKSALAEIRRTLGLLRSNGDPAETAPAPGVRDLPRLAEEVTRAGVAVDLRMDAPPSALPPGVDLTVFRLVQEALTNVVKHASATRARVSVRFEDEEIRLEVVDDGTASPAPHSAGHGIAGMRERATMHGGTFEAAPLPEGGFRVAAAIPSDGGAS